MKANILTLKLDAVGYVGSAYLLIYKNQIFSMEIIFTIITFLAPLSILLYHISKLRKEIVNEDHNGNWWSFLKSWFITKTKRKKK